MPVRPFALIACISLSCAVLPLDAQSVAVCGNGVREATEQCDDGNTTNLDGCSAQCKFEQSQRINQLKVQFGTTTSCTQNAFGSAFKSVVQGQLQSPIDQGITSGASSIVFTMLGLDDLTGTSDAAVEVGVVNATPVTATGVTYNGNADLDWWYTVGPSWIDSSRMPVNRLSGNIVTRKLTAAGTAGLVVYFGTVPWPLSMFALHMSALTGSSTFPAVSTGSAPPGHIASENLDLALSSYATSGDSITGELCGNIRASSLAQTPAPAALLGGGTSPCTEGYTAANSLLDTIVSGCHASIFVTLISPTQPDQADPAAPPAGGGAPYVLTVGASHVVTGCRDKNGAAVSDFRACLNAAGYSSFYKFSTDRVIAGRSVPPTITNIAPLLGPPAGGQTVTITGTSLDGATVTIGGLSASVTSTTSTSVLFVTPAHAAGVVDVTVTRSGASVTSTGGYTYLAPPVTPNAISAAAPSSTRIDVVWTLVSGATSYEVDRRSSGGSFGLIGTSLTNSFSDMTASAGFAYLYRVRAVNVGGASPSSAPALVTTLFMSNDPLIAGIPVKAMHLSQLRAAINAVRSLANLSQASVTDPATSGMTIKAVHVTELRSALDEARLILNLTTGAYTDPSLSGVLVKAVHFQELRGSAGTTPLPSGAGVVLVNEVATGTSVSASDEFVELFNPSATTAVEVSDWTVVYRSATAVSDTTLVTIPTGTIIQPLGYYLAGGSTYSGAAADQTFTTGLAAAGGAVGIRNGSGVLIDSVGWGTATNALVEGSAATAPAAGSSIGRSPNGQDTNNNASNFVVFVTPTPRAANP